MWQPDGAKSMSIVQPVRRADCRRDFCRFCHRDIPSDVFLSSGYLGNTVASKARLLETIRAKNARSNSTQGSHKHGKKPSLSKARRRSPFLELPLEVRLCIYRLCVEENSSVSSRSLCAWLEGGAWHPNNPPGTRWQVMDLYVYSHVPANLLAVSRQINQEATREVYRQTSVYMTLPIPVNSKIFAYWFGKHPLRFTKQLTISNSLRWTARNAGLSGGNRSDMLQYATIISLMPSLDTLKFSVDCWCESTHSMTDEFDMRLKRTWLKNLIVFRDHIPSNVEFTIEFTDTQSVPRTIPTPVQAQIRVASAKGLIDLLTRHKFVLIRTFDDPFSLRVSFEMARCDGAGSQRRHR